MVRSAPNTASNCFCAWAHSFAASRKRAAPASVSRNVLLRRSRRPLSTAIRPSRSSGRIFRPRVVRSMTISAVFSNFQLCKGRRFTLHILLGFTVNLQHLAFYLGHGLLHFLSQRGVIKNNLHISPDHKVAAS